MAKVAGTFVPADATVPVVDAKYIKGGLQVAANEAARLALPVAMLSVGTHVFQDDTNATWRVSAINGETVTWEDATPSAGASLTDIRDRMPTVYVCAASANSAALASASVTVGAQINTQPTGTLWAEGQLRFVAGGADAGSVYTLQANGTWTQTFNAAAAGDFFNVYTIATGTQAGNREIIKKNGTVSAAYTGLNATNIFHTNFAGTPATLNAIIGTLSSLLVPSAGQGSLIAAINSAFFPLLGAQLVYPSFCNSNNDGFFSSTVTIGDPVPGSCGLTYTIGMQALNSGFGGAGLGIYTLQSDGTWLSTNPMTDNGYRVAVLPAGRISGQFNAYTGTQIFRKSGSTKELVFGVRENAMKVSSASNGYANFPTALGEPFDFTTTAKTFYGAINEINAKAAATEVFSVVQTANEATCQTTVTLGTQVTDAGTGVLWASGNLRAVGSGTNRGAIYQVQSDGTSTLLHAHNVSSTGASTFNRWTVGQYNRVDLMQVVAGTVTPNTMMYQNSLRIWRALGSGGAQTVEAALLALEAKVNTLDDVVATGGDAAGARASIDAASVDQAYAPFSNESAIQVSQVGSTATVATAVTLDAQIPSAPNGTTWQIGSRRFANSGADAGAVYIVGTGGNCTVEHAADIDAAGRSEFFRWVQDLAGYTILVQRIDGATRLTYVGARNAEAHYFTDTGDGFRSTVFSKLVSIGKLANLVQSVKTSIVDALNELFGLTKKIPIDTFSADYSFVITDGGRMKMHPSADTTARVLTIPANASVAFEIGTVLTVRNQNAAGAVTIAITSDTMRLAGPGTTGSRTLAANGLATFTKETATEWVATGVGLT